MGLQQYRTLFLILTAVLALFVASPAIEKLSFYPQTTFFSEFSVFGQYNNATYPSIVTVADNNRLYLNLNNHLGSCAYYVIEPKFGNQTKYTPDSFNHTNSVLPSLGDITCFVANNESLQIPLDVSFQYQVNAYNSRQLDVQSITINGATIANPSTIAWNSEKQGFYGNLFFELWIYNATANALQYDSRYVSLWLQMET